MYFVVLQAFELKSVARQNIKLTTHVEARGITHCTRVRYPPSPPVEKRALARAPFFFGGDERDACASRERVAKAGAMFRKHAKPRGGVAHLPSDGEEGCVTAPSISKYKKYLIN